MLSFSLSKDELAEQTNKHKHKTAFFLNSSYYYSHEEKQKPAPFNLFPSLLLFESTLSFLAQDTRTRTKMMLKLSLLLPFGLLLSLAGAMPSGINPAASNMAQDLPYHGDTRGPEEIESGSGFKSQDFGKESVAAVAAPAKLNTRIVLSNEAKLRQAKDWGKSRVIKPSRRPGNLLRLPAVHTIPKVPSGNPDLVKNIAINFAKDLAKSHLPVKSIK